MLAQSRPENIFREIRSQGYQAYPQKKDWQLLREYTEPSMTPEEFVSYWDVTQEDIAKITCASRATVSRWFCQTSKYRPRVYHKYRLGVCHQLWMSLRNK